MLRRILADGTLEAIGSTGSGDGSAASTPVLTVRSIGSTRPDTTGWAVNDAWIDTGSTSPVNQIRLWTGSAFSPAETGAPSLGTLLLADDFTGTDGAVWSTTNWALGANPGAGTGGGATLLANAGVLATSNAGSYNGNGGIARRANISAVADSNILHRFKFDATESFFHIAARDDSSQADGHNGYLFSANSALGTWGVSKQVAYAGTDLGSAQTLAFESGAWYWVRFSVIGTAIKAKVWADGTTEPGTFPVSVTDSTYSAAGKIGFSLKGGAAASSSRVFLDDLTIRAS